jgi:hypothetical protein
VKLRFGEARIEFHAAAYSYSGMNKERRLLRLRDTVRTNGYLTKGQLRLLAEWKSPRSSPNVDNNSQRFVKEVTAFALTCRDERARIESLTVLDGVLWPTASVVLHLYHRDPYPIVDFRALWSVHTEPPTRYSYAFWQSYVDFCRSLAKRNRVSMRTLDRALWQYSKSNQSRT